MRQMTIFTGIALVVMAFLIPQSPLSSQVAMPSAAATEGTATVESSFIPPHSHMIVSTNFELEPVLAEYAKGYPNVSFADYRIVYKGENEWPDTPYTYIVIFSLPSKSVRGLRFWDYVDAWVKLHPGSKAAASVVDSVLPPLKRTNYSQTLGF